MTTEQINHSDMVAQLAKSGQAILNEMEPGAMHNLHMAIGIAGEIGELWEAYDKHDRPNILEEHGDLQFYIEGYRQGTGIAASLTSGSYGIMNHQVDEYMKRLSILGAELLDVTKKQAIYCKEIDIIAANGALGEIENIIVSLLVMDNFTVEQAKDQNIEKLGARYKGHQYSNEQAQDRADKAEEVDFEESPDPMFEFLNEIFPVSVTDILTVSYILQPKDKIGTCAEMFVAAQTHGFIRVEHVLSRNAECADLTEKGILYLVEHTGETNPS